MIVMMFMVVCLEAYTICQDMKKDKHLHRGYLGALMQLSATENNSYRDPEDPG